VGVELVAGRRLPGQADRRLSFQVVVERLPGPVEIDGPDIRIARVPVEPHARHGPPAARLPVRGIEPEPVGQNPAALHDADVVDAEELEGRPQARVLERLRVVAPLERAVRAAEVELAAEGVRTLAGDDVHDDPARLRVSEPAGSGQHDLL